MFYIYYNIIIKLKYYYNIVYNITPLQLYFVETVSLISIGMGVCDCKICKLL